MQRTLELSAESPYGIDRIRAAFDDADYWQARLAFVAGGAPTLDELSTAGDGTTTMQMSMRFGGDDLPGPLRRLRVGTLHVVQREEWSALDGDVVRCSIAVDAPRTPISGHGSVTLRRAVTGTRLVGTAVVDVRMPVIGGAIAGFIAGVLANGIVDVVSVTDAYLDGEN
ncbi:DUF2505 domain-containing protein [Mycolicibacterium sediminis]|uniref:DUF2505 domain-containing protein n=1 Tax=Mycolicibacterium sediminis TaxID=1286180 RepID=A0A7I7QI49_9MYCO|nr:DUF2505 domain-containing protein [Mycolicibacterium sediminis]BBY25922.1 hypothetical protein MSEDJ_00180 [Mycolicibacterium sediminis]